MIEGDLLGKVWLPRQPPQEVLLHANAKLTPEGRLILVQCITSGRAVTHVAAEMSVSRTTAGRWWRRWVVEGEDGPHDHSSRPTAVPDVHRGAWSGEPSTCAREKVGPLRVALRLGMAASTV